MWRSGSAFIPRVRRGWWYTWQASWKTFPYCSVFSDVNSCAERLVEGCLAVAELCWSIEYEPFYCYCIWKSQLVFIIPGWKGEFCCIHVTLIFDSSHPSCQEYRKERLKHTNHSGTALTLWNHPLKRTRATYPWTPGSWQAVLIQCLNSATGVCRCPGWW